MEKIVITTHNQIGYAANLDVIERALREEFGLSDASHVGTALAAHVWSLLCGGTQYRRYDVGVPEGSYAWDSRVVYEALDTIEARAKRLRQDLELVAPKQIWKTYPMGADATEKMEQRGMQAYLSHAVLLPASEQRTALCGVKVTSLVIDESLAEFTVPDCPKCARAIQKLGK